jgi:hypothetical protein
MKYGKDEFARNAGERFEEAFKDLKKAVKALDEIEEGAVDADTLARNREILFSYEDALAHLEDARTQLIRGIAANNAKKKAVKSLVDDALEQTPPKETRISPDGEATSVEDPMGAIEMLTNTIFRRSRGDLTMAGKGNVLNNVAAEANALSSKLYRMVQNFDSKLGKDFLRAGSATADNIYRALRGGELVITDDTFIGIAEDVDAYKGLIHNAAEMIKKEQALLFDRIGATGHKVGKITDHAPQMWSNAKVRQTTKKDFIESLKDELDPSMHKDPAAALERMWQNIQKGRSGDSMGGFMASRKIHFKDAEAALRAMGMYGDATPGEMIMMNFKNLSMQANMAEVAGFGGKDTFIEALKQLRSMVPNADMPRADKLIDTAESLLGANSPGASPYEFSRVASLVDTVNTLSAARYFLNSARFIVIDATANAVRGGHWDAFSGRAPLIDRGPLGVIKRYVQTINDFRVGMTDAQEEAIRDAMGVTMEGIELAKIQSLVDRTNDIDLKGFGHLKGAKQIDALNAGVHRIAEHGFKWSAINGANQVMLGAHARRLRRDFARFAGLGLKEIEEMNPVTASVLQQHGITDDMLKRLANKDTIVDGLIDPRLIEDPRLRSRFIGLVNQESYNIVARPDAWAQAKFQEMPIIRRAFAKAILQGQITPMMTFKGIVSQSTQHGAGPAITGLTAMTFGGVMLTQFDEIMAGRDAFDWDDPALIIKGIEKGWGAQPGAVVSAVFLGPRTGRAMGNMDAWANAIGPAAQTMMNGAVGALEFGFHGDTDRLAKTVVALTPYLSNPVITGTSMIATGRNAGQILETTLSGSNGRKKKRSAKRRDRKIKKKGFRGSDLFE